MIGIYPANTANLDNHYINIPLWNVYIVTIALDKEEVFQPIILRLSWYCRKLVEGSHKKCLGEALLMSTHNIHFHEEKKEKKTTLFPYPL